jgi:hypothetical protein
VPLHKPGLYKFVDNEGDEHSLHGLNEDDAMIALLRALPLGITVKPIGFEPDPEKVESPKLSEIKQTQPGPGGTRLAGRRKAYGRNDQCPCGSGKKVKRCCGRR